MPHIDETAYQAARDAMTSALRLVEDYDTEAEDIVSDAIIALYRLHRDRQIAAVRAAAEAAS